MREKDNRTRNVFERERGSRHCERGGDEKSSEKEKGWREERGATHRKREIGIGGERQRLIK